MHISLRYLLSLSLIMIVANPLQALTVYNLVTSSGKNNKLRLVLKKDVKPRIKPIAVVFNHRMQKRTVTITPGNYWVSVEEWQPDYKGEKMEWWTHSGGYEYLSDSNKINIETLISPKTGDSYIGHRMSFLEDIVSVFKLLTHKP